MGVSGWLSQLSDWLLILALLGHVLAVCEFEPHVRLSLLSVWSLLGILSPPSLCPSPIHTHTHMLSYMLSLSKINKMKKWGGMREFSGSDGPVLYPDYSAGYMNLHMG